MDLRDVIEMEHKILSHLMIETENFIKAVQHLLVSKHKTRPPWNPATIHEVTEEQVREAMKAKSIPAIQFE